MQVFIQVVLPVFLVFTISFIVQKWKKVDIKPISTVAVYIMVPCLIFRTFYNTELNSQYLYMAVFAILLLISLIIIAILYSRVKKYNQSQESGLILSTAFMNAGNYGAPIILFAYGEAGFAYAVSFMIIQSILMNSAGVYYAARGEAGFRVAVKAIAQMPATYVVIVVSFIKMFQIPVPDNLMMTIDIIANASIPTVMIILGMQLALIKWGNFDWGKVAFGTIVRLGVSPAIAYLITLFLPLDPLISKVLIVSAAMPSAATIVMYAVQFNSEPKLVSSTTLVTTLFSVITITILLSLLG